MKRTMILLFAALLGAAAACSDFQTEPATFSNGKFHMTVKAGINAFATKCGADYNRDERTYTMKFVDGDKLYVYGTYGDCQYGGEANQEPYWDYIICGYLTATDAGNSDEFSGDLAVYKAHAYDYMEEEMAFFHLDYNQQVTDIQELIIFLRNLDPSIDFDINSPLESCTDCNAIVEHAGTTIDIDPVTLQPDGYSPQDQFTSTAAELMETKTNLMADYNSANNSFTFSEAEPIMDCTITNLTPDEEYLLVFLYSYNPGSFYDNDINNFFTDDDGSAHFAFVPFWEYNYYGLRFVCANDPTDVREVDLGAKELETNKVYVVSVNMQQGGPN